MKDTGLFVVALVFVALICVLGVSYVAFGPEPGPTAAPFIDPTEVDQCMRTKLFQECLQAIPKGPSSVVNNDWDEVVDSCESASYHQALRPKSQIAAQCRSRS